MSDFVASKAPISADVVHAFWFEETTIPDHDLNAALIRWFRATGEFDALVRDRFADAIRRGGAGEFDHWCESTRGRLSLIVLLDQLPRNAFRGTPDAFAFDAKARFVCREGIARGDEQLLVPVERHFFYLPLLHSEDLADQELSVNNLEQLRRRAPASQIDYFQAVVDAALRYRSVIARFGRFPHRNAALGRTSTPDELEFMAASTPRWEKGPRAG